MVKLKKFFTRIVNDKNMMRGISTLIGTGLLNFIMGAVYSLSTLAVYEISYIKAKGGSIDIYHLAFYFPLEMFFQCISSFFSGSVYKKIGLHLTDTIGVIILLLGYALFYISESLWQDLTAVILSGIGTGIILYPSTSNAIDWFESGNGLIVGIMESMISLGSFFFCFLGEKVINKKGVESNDEDNLYDFDIGKNFKSFMIILIICLIVSFVLSLLLMREKKKSDQENYYTFQKEISNNNNKNENANNNNKENIQEKNNNNINNNKKDLVENNNEINDNNINQEEKKKKIEELIDNNQINEGINQKEINNNNNQKNDDTTINKFKINPNQQQEIPVSHNEINEEKSKNNALSKKEREKQKQLKLKQSIKLAIKSRRLTLFVIIVIFQIPVGSMAFALYREIGEYKKIDIKYLQLIGSFTFIFECLSSFVFGLLCDYVTIKKLLFAINGIGTFFGFFYCLSFNNSLTFFLVQILLSFSSGGFYPVKDFFLLKVFPKEIYIELNSYVTLLVSIAINVFNSLSYFVLSLINNKDTGFWILFISFGVLSLIGFILNCFTNEAQINLRERMKK